MFSVRPLVAVDWAICRAVSHWMGPCPWNIFIMSPNIPPNIPPNIAENGSGSSPEPPNRGSRG